MKQKRLVLLLCICGAFIIWLLYTLSNEYSAYFRYSLDVETNLEGRASHAEANNSLLIQGRGRGFYIIRNSWRRHNQNVRVFVEPQWVHEYADRPDAFYVLAENLHNVVNDALGMNLVVEQVLTDTLKLHFPKEYFKKVPVLFLTDLQYAPQYMSFSHITLTPDSVLVYGLEQQVSLIESVSTKKVILENVYRTSEGIARLDVPEGTRLSDKEVTYEVPVERYVEMTLEVPVVAQNVPVRMELFLLPDKVALTFRVPFSQSLSVSIDDFLVSVDYNAFQQSPSGKVVPVVTSGLHTLSHVQCSPAFVDGIVQHK